MNSVVDTVTLTTTETVVVQDYYPESVSLTQTERIVERHEEGTVVVTGVLGPRGITTISAAGDIDLSGLVNGATLVYDQNLSKWVATKELDSQVMNGGFF
jgi:hypothetical protein